MSVCALPRHVEVVCDGEGSRSLIARAAFEPGQCVITNVPIAQNVLGTQISERCSNCFCKSDKLQQCCRCAFVRYCSRNCQKQDWPKHRGECKSLAALQLTTSPTIMQEVGLLVRVFNAIEQDQQERPCESTDRGICCSTGHVLDMATLSRTPPRFSDEDTFVAATVKEILKKEPLDSIQQMQLRFKCNNFGVMDELMQCIGAGVFPAVALLNHSCRPSCILRYVLSPGQPITLQVIASRAIAVGEELTHAYVDLVEPASTRRAKLMDIYNFLCTCPRCNPSPTENISTHMFPVQFLRDGSYRSLLASCAPPFHERSALDVEHALTARRDQHVTAEKYHHVVGQANDLSLQAIRSSSPEEEQVLANMAVESLLEVCGPFNIELYTARGNLMTACLVEGNFERAAEECLHVVGFLYAVLRDVPFHPLLGLQLFTLGDILHAIGPASGLHTADVCTIYRQAREILYVAYGADHPLVLRLTVTLGELSKSSI